MQKLTVKELAPYLPYGLKCQVTDNGLVKTDTLLAVYADGSCSFANIVESQKGFEEIKPILRHPSALKFEFEHEGENIVPLLDFFDSNEKEMYSFANSKTPLFLNYPYTMWSQLLEWKIDIFGLIGQGLAIDMHTFGFAE